MAPFRETKHLIHALTKINKFHIKFFTFITLSLYECVCVYLSLLFFSSFFIRKAFLENLISTSNGNVAPRFSDICSSHCIAFYFCLHTRTHISARERERMYPYSSIFCFHALSLSHSVCVCVCTRILFSTSRFMRIAYFGRTTNHQNKITENEGTKRKITTTTEQKIMCIHSHVSSKYKLFFFLSFFNMQHFAF